jgi:hypothetical protein
MPPGSEACPLSLRDVLGVMIRRRGALPMFRTPLPAVARAALLAAKREDCALALMLPRGAPAHPWFASVIEIASEVAPGMPFVLSGEVCVEGESDAELDRAVSVAYGLVDAGLTHVAVDASAVPAGARAAAIARVAAPVLEQELALECVLPAGDGLPSASRVAAFVDALRELGVELDLASIRCGPAAQADEAETQLRRIAEICAALRGVPIFRRGPLSSALLPRLASSPLKGVEDGGTAFAALLGALPSALRERIAARASELYPDVAASADALERAAATLIKASEPLDAGGDRTEALAFMEAAAFVEVTAATGSALDVADALVAQLE